MILSSLSRSALFNSLHPLFKSAFEWLAENADAALAEGKTEIDGDRLFCNSQQYDTHPFDWRKFETHDKYIDIQYIISGAENIWLGDPAVMETAIAYDPDKDIRFLAGCGSPVLLSAGEFMVIWPHEAHAPMCDPAHEAIKVKKIIVKVPVHL